MSVVVSVVSKVAFAGDSVEGFMFSTSSAGTQDPEVSIFTIALSVFQISVFTTILIVATSSVDDSEARVADAALSFLVPV